MSSASLYLSSVLVPKAGASRNGTFQCAWKPINLLACGMPMRLSLWTMNDRFGEHHCYFQIGVLLPMGAQHVRRPAPAFSSRATRSTWSMVAVAAYYHFLSVSSILRRHHSFCNAFVNITPLLLRRSSRLSSTSLNPVPFVVSSPKLRQDQGMKESMAGTRNQDRSGQPPILAKIVSSSNSLPACGSRLREGHLVAFPTETVYGLGCHALDESAISKVFQAKERPLTDPLIVHVTNVEDALRLWEGGSTDVPSQTPSGSIHSQILLALCQQFWPGPLTLVAKAASHVPPILMANTGYVACRSPSHPIARKLIDEARVPLAAPSANKFGHVSPTSASHVWDDLLHEDVWIIDSRQDASSDSAHHEASVVCQVGVESTVAKIEMIEPSSLHDSTTVGRVTLLRQGAISVDNVKECLQRAGLLDSMKVESQTMCSTADDTAAVAPGQTIRHYSPRIPSFLLAHSIIADDSPSNVEYLSKSVVVDFGGRLNAWKEYVLAYRDISTTGDSSEAARVIFDTLRWAEQVQGGDRILFPEIGDENGDVDPLKLAVKDRLTRAASGVVIDTLR